MEISMESLSSDGNEFCNIVWCYSEELPVFVKENEEILRENKINEILGNEKSSIWGIIWL